jgi:Ca2+-binding EF-hand superfamily protein
MTRPTRAVTAGAGLLAGLALALAPPPALGQGKPTGEVQDLAFLGGNRPVLLRVHILRDGKPFAAGRDQYVKRWFDYLDRDGDGVLDQKEARFVPSLQSLQQLRNNGFFLPRGNGFATLRELDRDGDGKVSLDELTFHFERAGYRAVEVVNAGSQRALYDRPSEVLFQQLDPKGEGKLSKDGVRQAADMMLKKFDTDDDELISIEELVPDLGNPFGPRPLVAQLPGGRPMSGPVTNSFYAIRPGANDQQLGRLLLTSFAKKKAFQMSRAESGLDQETFDRLDTNRDGLLDLDELSRWHQRPADIELVMRLGKGRASPVTVEVRGPGGKPGQLPPGVDRPVDGLVRLTLGDAQVTVRPGNLVGDALVVRAGTARALLQQFQAADTKKQGYLTQADLTGRAQVLAPLMPLADRNGDGKVTMAEMTALLNLLEDASVSSISIGVGEHGRALFQLLDTNGDGRLGLRELRSAWDRLAKLDKNGDGFISADEIPRQFELTVGQGFGPALRQPVVANRVVTRPVAARAPTRGPLWFRKMDLNGDGDVSPREFLGTPEEFRQIDTDGDGLISVEEAERYDALKREKKETRR